MNLADLIPVFIIGALIAFGSYRWGSSLKGDGAIGEGLLALIGICLGVLVCVAAVVVFLFGHVHPHLGWS